MDALDLFAELSSVFLSLDGRLIPAFIAALSHVTELRERVGQREVSHAFRQALLVSPGFLSWYIQYIPSHVVSCACDGLFSACIS